jgi:GTPase SAR1 family protein
MSRVYFKDAHGALLFFDVTQPSTLEMAARWKVEIDSHVFYLNEKGERKPIPVLLLANKVKR